MRLHLRPIRCPLAELMAKSFIVNGSLDEVLTLLFSMISGELTVMDTALASSAFALGYELNSLILFVHNRFGTQ